MLYPSAVVIVLLLFTSGTVADQHHHHDASVTGDDEACPQLLPIPPDLPFHPVMMLPPQTRVLDLTIKKKQQQQPMDDDKHSLFHAWTIGKYDEDRVIYDQPLFGGKRTIHVGVDLGGPAYSSVHAFYEGQVIECGINPAFGDYGPTLVTMHVLPRVPRPLYALFGHLSKDSLLLSPKGRKFATGDVLGWVGTMQENGGWPITHVHFQLSWERPTTHDMPGAVAKEDREAALKLYPDPQLVLGKLY